jgi:hypothetical protein
MYWSAALVAVVVDLLLVGLLAWRVKRPVFERLGRPLLVTSLVFWATLYSWALFSFWDGCYEYVLPAWARWVVIPFGLVVGGLGAVFWWLAL